MEQLPGTPQDVKYVWHGRKPFHVPEGREIKQGETFTPTEEMIAAFRDLMIPVGVADRVQAADAKIAAAKDEVAKAEAEKAEARTEPDPEPSGPAAATAPEGRRTG